MHWGAPLPTVHCSRMDEADTAASPAGPKLAPLLLPAETTPGLDAPVDAAGLGVPTPTSRGKTPTRKWTTEEDALLQNAVRDHDGKSWKKISEALPNRSEVRYAARPPFRALSPNVFFYLFRARPSVERAVFTDLFWRRRHPRESVWPERTECIHEQSTHAPLCPARFPPPPSSSLFLSSPR